LAQDYCFDEASAQYGLASELLRAISKTESNFDHRAINFNTNGTYDFCHMQINSSWAKILGDNVWESIGDPCQCTKVGAWILSWCINEHGYTWDAVGCYHSKKKNRRIQYAWKIHSALTRIK
jgi:soluble lytic murein transglycosylase-like protein